MGHCEIYKRSFEQELAKIVDRIDHHHRIVVIPEIMAADGALVSALRISADSGAPGSPESVQIREIQTSTKDRVTVIYGVNMAHADYWDLPGGQVLTDEQGRPIALTEGLVICRPVMAVRQDGITQEDLDLAHSLVVPAYLEFWAQGRDYARQAAKSFMLAISGWLRRPPWTGTDRARHLLATRLFQAGHSDRDERKHLAGLDDSLTVHNALS
jgi:hypothetical protein